MLRLLIRYSGNRRKLRPSGCLFCYWRLVLPGPTAFRILPAGSQIDYGMPERLGRQVAPSPTAPWSAPDLRGYTSLLKTAEPSPIDPQKAYNLVELIDIAERANPETRVAWKRHARPQLESDWSRANTSRYSQLSALGGYQSEAFPAPKGRRS